MFIDHFLLPRWFGISRPLAKIPAWSETAWFNWPALIALCGAVFFGAWASGIVPGEDPTRLWGIPPLEAWVLGGVTYVAGRRARCRRRSRAPQGAARLQPCRERRGRASGCGDRHRECRGSGAGRCAARLDGCSGYDLMATTRGETTAAAAAAAAVDWEQMEAWDRAYYLHNVQGAEEHIWNGVAYQEGNYLYMVDGTRLLDCQSQLISDNMGHRHPRVVAGLRRRSSATATCTSGWRPTTVRVPRS